MINTTEDQLLVVCLTAALCLVLMLWLYFSNGEPQEKTVLVSPFSGGASAPSTEQVYQVQIKDWVNQEFTFHPLMTGTADECQALKKDLLRRGHPVSDVRVVQLVQLIGESA